MILLWKVLWISPPEKGIQGYSHYAYRDTPTTIPVNNWFGMPPQSAPSAVGKGIS
jgi:hypothetical protein